MAIPGYKHGMAPKYGTRPAIYTAWRNMRRRCDYPKTQMYYRYGARGITYDPRWADFREFLLDMGATWELDLTLERIDNNGNYTKNNCRWATVIEQANNKRNNHYFEYQNERKTLPMWARQVGIKRSTLSMRMYKYKWSIDKALTTPVRQRGAF